MYKYLSVLAAVIFIFSASLSRAETAAVAWAPLTEELRSEHTLNKIAAGEEISYHVHKLASAKRRNIPQIEEAACAWFENVLKYRKRYQGFNEVFADILPILERGPLLVPFDNTTRAQGQLPDITFFFTADKMDIVSNKRRAARGEKPTAGGFHHVDKYNRHTIYVKINSGLDRFLPIEEHVRNRPRRFLIHEIGHILGLADLYQSGRWNANMEAGSGIKRSIMNTSDELTCDDADALIGTIDIALGNKRVFRSFCDNGYMYENNKYMRITQYNNRKKQQLTDSLKTAAQIKGL